MWHEDEVAQRQEKLEQFECPRPSKRAGIGRETPKSQVDIGKLANKLSRESWRLVEALSRLAPAQPDAASDTPYGE